MTNQTITPRPAFAPRDLMSLPNAATYMSVNERFMRRLVNERRIKHYKLGSLLRFSRRDLDAFMTADVRAAIGGSDA